MAKFEYPEVLLDEPPEMVVDVLLEEDSEMMVDVLLDDELDEDPEVLDEDTGVDPVVETNVSLAVVVTPSFGPLLWRR